MQESAYPLTYTTMVEIEVDLYSGRLNPRFALTPEQASEFGRRLAALPPADPAPAAEPGLGYRGLIVTGLPGSTAVHVFAGRLTPSAGGVRMDPGREVERWLLDLAVLALPAEVSPALRDSLTR